ncbi:MAG: 3'-5' exonuclease [Pirellulaceae bacterium]|nr:3'-5' exonuclease [Pirellulaceae bacterium]
MARSPVKYLVFDIESVADGDLIAKVIYGGEPGLSGDEALQRYRAELVAKQGNDFVPHTFHVPVSVVVGKLDKDLNLLDVVALDEPQFRPHVITDHFWRGWLGYQKPTLVSFNGRSFDLPVLELASFRYGLSLPAWFNLGEKTYQQHRNRYNLESHLDLHDVLTNYSACRFNGGLNLVAQLLGKPGKMDVSGFMVQDLFIENRLDEINNYCRCDVLDTYFVFLRTALLMGWIDLKREKELVKNTRQWLEQHTESTPAFGSYLKQWQDWVDPW